jgi:hypothetical protein
MSHEACPRSWDFPGGGMEELKAHLEADGFRIDGFTALVPGPSPAETETLILEFVGRYREER